MCYPTPSVAYRYIPYEQMGDFFQRSKNELVLSKHFPRIQLCSETVIIENANEWVRKNWPL
jgi:hypothetical protein